MLERQLVITASEVQGIDYLSDERREAGWQPRLQRTSERHAGLRVAQGPQLMMTRVE